MDAVTPPISRAVEGAGGSPPPIPVRVRVNGRDYAESVPPRLLLSDFLRHGLGLTGTHVGCEQGVCGMCTVLVDGAAVKSCLMLAAQLEGRRVDTVESLTAGSELSPLQQRFKQEHALQCGFCTPAFLMTATALAAGQETRSRDDIRDELAGVLCRCTGYDFIVEAVHAHLASDGKAAADE